MDVVDAIDRVEACAARSLVLRLMKGRCLSTYPARTSCSRVAVASGSAALARCFAASCRLCSRHVRRMQPHRRRSRRASSAFRFAAAAAAAASTTPPPWPPLPSMEDGADATRTRHSALDARRSAGVP